MRWCLSLDRGAWCGVLLSAAYHGPDVRTARVTDNREEESLAGFIRVGRQIMIVHRNKNLVVPTEVVRAEKLSSLCLGRQDEQPPGDKRIKTDKEHFSFVVSFFLCCYQALSFNDRILFCN